MNQTKGFAYLPVIIAAIVVLAGAGYFLLKDTSMRSGDSDALSATSTIETATTTVEQATTSVKTDLKVVAPQKVSASITLAEGVAVFKKSQTAIKARDLAGLKAVVYNPNSLACSGDRCDQIMDFLYNLTKNVNPAVLVKITSDSKQAVISSMPVKIDEDKSVSYSMEKIYLIRGTNGAVKLLSSQTPVWKLSKETGGTYNLEQILQDAMKDTDGDGLTNEVETCTGAKANDVSCKKTDPNKRDTDGDGLWDGIEAELAK